MLLAKLPLQLRIIHRLTMCNQQHHRNLSKKIHKRLILFAMAKVMASTLSLHAPQIMWSAQVVKKLFKIVLKALFLTDRSERVNFRINAKFLLPQQSKKMLNLKNFNETICITFSAKQLLLNKDI